MTRLPGAPREIISGYTSKIKPTWIEYPDHQIPGETQPDDAASESEYEAAKPNERVEEWPVYPGPGHISNKHDGGRPDWDFTGQGSEERLRAQREYLKAVWEYNKLTDPEGYRAYRAQLQSDEYFEAQPIVTQVTTSERHGRIRSALSTVMRYLQ